MNALVDQRSDVNVMPLSTYMKLTDERPAETDIGLSLASHSYIYPFGIVEDILVEVAEHVYPVDFVILDIKEDEKRPFILGTSFMAKGQGVINLTHGHINSKGVCSKGGWDDEREELGPEYATGMDDEGEVTKVHLLEDKQIPGVGVFDEVFSTWMAYVGNTCDLGSFGEETDKITDLHQIHEEVLFTERGDSIAGIKRRRRDLSSDGVRMWPT
ncbi:zinc finger, CCHC-type containing protein [Tanacetum coccineum]